MSSQSWKLGLVSISLSAATSYAIAQMSGPAGTQGSPSDQPMLSSQDETHSQMHARMMQMMQGGAMHGSGGHQGMMGMHGGLTHNPLCPVRTPSVLSKRSCKFCNPIPRRIGLR
jgi:hypothetical protein